MAHADFCRDLLVAMIGNGARRKAGILPVPRDVSAIPDLFPLVEAACRQLHSRHHVVDPATGVRVSVGAVRWANTRQAVMFARHLLDRNSPEIRVICYHSKFLAVTRLWMEQQLEDLLTRKGGSQPYDHPAVRAAIEDARGKGHQDVIVIISTSPIIEVGRDFDLDWGVVDPSGQRQLIQFAGRIGRHRDQRPQDPNILLLENPARAFLGNGDRVFQKPGVETAGQEWHAPCGQKWSVGTDRTDVAFDMSALSDVVDAKERVGAPHSPIARLEHAKLAHHLLDASSAHEYSDVSLCGFVKEYPVSGMSSYHIDRMCFRRPPPHSTGVRLTLENDQLRVFEATPYGFNRLSKTLETVNERHLHRLLFSYPSPDTLFAGIAEKVLPRHDPVRLWSEIVSLDVVTRNVNFSRGGETFVYSLQLGFED
jgi:CRISPR-associated endonuclease/helicase Cas3